MTATVTTALVAHRIRRIRKQAGLQVGQVAKAAGWSGAKQSRIEGGRQEITLSQLTTIADCIGTTAEHLLSAGDVCPTCNQELLD